jgi:hypothetical protein
MALDAGEPRNRQVTELEGYMRETRAAVNAISGSGNVGVTELEIALAATTLSVGTELDDFSIEVIILTAAAAVVITNIYLGVEGMIKIFVCQDANVSFTDGPKLTGQLYLDQGPLSDFDMGLNDILAIVNVGGDGAAEHGWWQELFRKESVR